MRCRNYSFYLMLLSQLTQGVRFGVSVDEEFLQKMIQYIVERKMVGLFQRFGARVVVLDGSERATMLFHMLLQRIPTPTIVMKRTDELLNMNKMASPSITYVFVEDETETEEFIKHLQNSNIHQSNTPTVMVKLFQIDGEYTFNVFSILKSAWRLGLVRFLPIYSDGTIKALSYNPFTNVVIDASNRTGNALFPRHLNNLHRYLLRVSLFDEWPLLRKKPGLLKRGSQRWFGSDFVILKEIVKLMNATFRVVEPPKNTGYIGSMQDILDEKVDFCFVRRFPVDGFGKFRFVSTGSLSSLSVIVSKADHEEKVISVLLVFRKEIWFCLILTVMILLFTMRILFLKNKTHGNVSSFLDIWKILLNIPLETTIHRKYTSRIPLVTWIWSSLILSVSFQCRLIDLMKYPQFEVGIESLKDLERSKLPVYTSYDYVKMQGDSGYLRHQMKLVSYKEVLEKLHEIGSKSAVVMPYLKMRGKLSAEFLEYVDSRKKVVLAERLVRSYAVYTFPYFSPFNNAVYVAILRITQYGFMDKLPKSLRHEDEIKKVHKHTFSLNLKHIISAFHFLCFGLGLSAIVFILEISTVSKRKSV